MAIVSPIKTGIARRMRRDMTDAERLLWSRLRHGGLGGHHFRRQEPIGPYVADFVCRANSLVIEIDGGQHAERTEADARRTEVLRLLGFEILRFWNNEVLGNIEGVVATIGARLRGQ